jgi:hypothetical protein
VASRRDLDNSACHLVGNRAKSKPVSLHLLSFEEAIELIFRVQPDMVCIAPKRGKKRKLTTTEPARNQKGPTAHNSPK